MSDATHDTSQPSESRGLRLEDVARAAAELSAERELSGLLERFRDRVREWASPSALLAAIQDSSAESGWRLLPALSFGSGPLGAEGSLPGLVESAPGCLERPTVVRPDEEVPGVKPRDNCIVPWAHEGDSGILVLRGVPRPSPPNLGEAVAVLSAPVWPRLLGGPVPRIESLLVELRRVAERLEEDTGRQIERLRASRPPGEEAPATAEDSGRVSELERQLDAARQATQRSEAEQGEVRERMLALETALKESEAARDQARAEADKLSARAESLHSEHAKAISRLEERCRSAEAAARTAEEVRAAFRQELEETRAEAEHSTLEWDELKGRVAVLEEALQDAEGERDRVRDEAGRLSSRIESMQSDHASALEKAQSERASALESLKSEHTSTLGQVEERRRTAETALRKALEDLTEAQKEAKSAREASPRPDAGGREEKERVATLEKALKDAEAERDQARARMGKLEDRQREAESALKTAQEERDKARRAAESGQGNAKEADEQKERVATLEQALKGAEADHDRVHAELKRLQEKQRETESALKKVEKERDTARREAESAERSAKEGGEETDRVARLEKALKETETERDRARAQVAQLEEQHQEAESAVKEARVEQAAAKQELEKTRKRLEKAERQKETAARGGPEGGPEGGKALETLRASLAVLRRTPFVPPGLRHSMEQGGALVEEKGDGPERWFRVAVLDRDATSLEPLAGELEEAGLEVKIASYPEELALLMKTPEAKELDAIICDILAFRPDQTVAGLFRGWAKDRPGLRFFLSFAADDPAEAERASRVPSSLTAGRFSRPIPGAELLEKLKVLSGRKDT
jgi:chromosome segregation ATPase